MDMMQGTKLEDIIIGYNQILKGVVHTVIEEYDLYKKL